MTSEHLRPHNPAPARRAKPEWMVRRLPCGRLQSPKAARRLFVFAARTACRGVDQHERLTCAGALMRRPEDEPPSLDMISAIVQMIADEPTKPWAVQDFR